MRWIRIPREKGAVLAAVAVFLGAFFAMAVVAVDIARLGLTASEVQTVADVAATAGARALLEDQPVEAQALAVAAGNTIDGTPAAPSDVALLIGNYDTDGGTFALGGDPENAVRANVSREVQNLVAGIFGDPATTVQKTATAALVTLSTARPELPMALGDCCFPEDCMDDACLPGETHPSTGDNSAWTGFFNGVNQTDVLAYIPAPCGGGASPPSISVGDDIFINNGQMTPAYQALVCLCQNGMNEFLVPVVACEGGGCGQTQFNQTMEVTGFATVKIDAIHFTVGQTGETRACTTDIAAHPGSPDAVDYHAIVRTDPSSGGGGGSPCSGCGTLVVSLVE